MENEVSKTNSQVTENDLQTAAKVFKPRGRSKESRTEQALKVIKDAKEKGASLEPEKKEVVTPEKKEEKQEQQILETPFFKIKAAEKAKEENQQNKVDFTNWDNLSAYAKENGFDLKNPNDLELVFKAVRDERTKTKDYEPQINEWKNKATSFEKLMMNMPPEIANPFLEWANGGDYKSEIRKITETPFDLTISADKHDELQLVNFFGEDKYTKEEWEGLEPKVQKSFIASAKQLYNVKQQDFLSTREKANNSKLEKQDKFNKSVDAAIANLKKDYPDMKESEVQEVRQQMLGGINKTLFNDDGTYKETAAKQISMVVYGEQTLGTMKTALEAKMKAETSKILSGEREKILLAGQDGVNLGRGAGEAGKNKLVEEARKQLKNVLGRVGK